MSTHFDNRRCKSHRANKRAILVAAMLVSLPGFTVVGQDGPAEPSKKAKQSVELAPVRPVHSGRLVVEQPQAIQPSRQSAIRLNPHAFQVRPTETIRTVAGELEKSTLATGTLSDSRLVPVERLGSDKPSKSKATLLRPSVSNLQLRPVPVAQPPQQLAVPLGASFQLVPEEGPRLLQEAVPAPGESDPVSMQFSDDALIAAASREVASAVVAAVQPPSFLEPQGATVPEESTARFALTDLSEGQASTTGELGQATQPEARIVVVAAPSLKVPNFDADATEPTESSGSIKEEDAEASQEVAASDDSPVRTNEYATETEDRLPLLNDSPEATHDQANEPGKAKSPEVPRTAIPLPAPPAEVPTEDKHASADQAPRIAKPAKNLVIEVPKAGQEIQGSSGASSSQATASLFAALPSERVAIETGQTREIIPTSGIRRIELRNREVCDAVIVNPHKLLLIGRSDGETRLAVWCDNASEPVIYSLQVSATPISATGSSLEAVAMRLTDTISTTYPKCRVRVVAKGDSLVVHGQVNDKHAAREIMRLVRTACLKTVHDELQIR